MKRFIFALVVLSTLLGGQAAVRAQDFERVSDYDPTYESNRDENGKVVRGAYLTNDWYDNWSFGIAGGVQTLTSKSVDGILLTPIFEISALKWYTPTIAARFGWNGYKLKENYPTGINPHHFDNKNVDGVNYYNEFLIHGDLMLNATSLFWGYKRDRFWNCLPYVHASIITFIHPDYKYFNPVLKDENGDPVLDWNDKKQYMRDPEFAFGAGIYNTFRITDHINATLDLRVGTLPSRYHDQNSGVRTFNPSAQVGLTYTIHKWYWTRSKGLEATRDAALADALRKANDLQDAQNLNDALQAENDSLQTENVNLQTEVMVIRDTVYQVREAEREKDALIARMQKADLVLYYDINVDKLNFNELQYLDNYVKQTCASDPYHVFYITGSADEGTGNEAINTRLCNARANGVKKLLIRKYGVPESQVVIKAAIISNKHEDGRLDRCVLLESE